MAKKPDVQPSKWANEAYEVGKGKPPKEHQFKAGQTSPNPKGRPRGAKNQTSFQKLLNKRVEVGRTDAGRVIYMTLGEVADHQLLKKASGGDLAALRIVKDFEAKMAALAYRHGPSPEDLRAKFEEEAQKVAHAAKICAFVTNFLDQAAQLKRCGMADFVDGQLVIEAWVVKEGELRLAQRAVEPESEVGAVAGRLTGLNCD